MMKVADHLLRATAYEGLIRCSAITSQNLCQTATDYHKLSPIVAVALGRLMSGALLLGQDLKNDSDQLTITINGSGPIGGMTVVVRPGGKVKGLVQVPVVEATYHHPGKFNVGAAIGEGYLTVVRSTSIAEPYVGRIELASGEIAEDLVAYCFYSEQIPTMMSLGVRVDKDGIEVAGGLLIQALPGVTDEILDDIEARIKAFGDITPHLQSGISLREILEELLGDNLDNDLSDMPVNYCCDCSADGMERALLTLGDSELRELAKDPSGITLECHFCPHKYHFDQNQIKGLMNRGER